MDNQYIINPLSLHVILIFLFFVHHISLWKRIVSFRFVSFDFVSFRSVSFRFVSISFRTLQVPHRHLTSGPPFFLIWSLPRLGSSHYSDSPFLRQPITPTTHFSENPLFRQPITPTMTNIYINFVIFLKTWPWRHKTWEFA